YKYTLDDDECNTKIFSTELDCDNILIDSKIKVPEILLSSGYGGSLKNGAYQFTIAYNINRQRVTEFFTVTNPIQVWSHENKKGSVN
ncbi:hypothetical protein ACS2TL_27235, partial [Bacillus cereus group sp. BC326]|uniref:hypothetical protein n=1 Tax=Bacillus cereus group sp. BC326 TaxID=3445310 RepID=UPI003F21C114